MTQESALDFVKRTNEDSALSRKVQSAGTNVDMIMRLAQDAGFDFSAADYQAATTQYDAMREAGEVPLAESDLDLIAGGEDPNNNSGRPNV